MPAGGSVEQITLGGVPDESGSPRLPSSPPDRALQGGGLWEGRPDLSQNDPVRNFQHGRVRLPTPFPGMVYSQLLRGRGRLHVWLEVSREAATPSVWGGGAV